MKTITPTKTVCYAVSDKGNCSYIEAGYWHEVISARNFGFDAALNRSPLPCLYTGCNHLKGDNWRIIVREELV